MTLPYESREYATAPALRTRRASVGVGGALETNIRIAATVVALGVIAMGCGREARCRDIVQQRHTDFAHVNVDAEGVVTFERGNRRVVAQCYTKGVLDRGLRIPVRGDVLAIEFYGVDSQSGYLYDKQGRSHLEYGREGALHRERGSLRMRLQYLEAKEGETDRTFRQAEVAAAAAAQPWIYGVQSSSGDWSNLIAQRDRTRREIVETKQRLDSLIAASHRASLCGYDADWLASDGRFELEVLGWYFSARVRTPDESDRLLIELSSWCPSREQHGATSRDTSRP